VTADPLAIEPNAPDGPPMFDVWATLIERWLALPPTPEFGDQRRLDPAGGKRTKSSLVAHMNQRFGEKWTTQSVSQWGTGTDRERPPPWKAVLFLLRELNLDLVISGDAKSWLVVARKRR
jgi:hypothetical protein